MKDMKYSILFYRRIHNETLNRMRILWNVHDAIIYIFTGKLPFTEGPLYLNRPWQQVNVEVGMKVVGVHRSKGWIRLE